MVSRTMYIDEDKYYVSASASNSRAKFNLALGMVLGTVFTIFLTLAVLATFG